jgi:hypothetical protein
MSEEHAGRHGSSRGSEESRELDPTELSAALQRSVASIGASGPPRAGLSRIRRRAKARQRRRTVAASSAGVLMLAMVVGAVTGSKFDIVPVLTGVVGLGGNSTSNGAPTAMPHAGGSGQVRTVRPPAAVAGKKGPAIGPVAPTSSPTALSSAGIPQCTSADLKVTASVDSVINGVSYGHVEAVADTTCAVAGPPVLQVANVAGTAVSSVVILQHESADGSQLPNVATWGAVLKLQSGQGYAFQFAWAPDMCPASGPTASASASNLASPAASQSTKNAYSLSYLVAGDTPTTPVDLEAACGATVYVTDVYGQGAYALPQPPASPTAQASTTSAPSPTQSPSTQSPATSTPTSSATSPTATESSSSASNGGNMPVASSSTS